MRISEEPQEEFRLAGISPGELDKQMMQRLFQQVEERRVRDAELAKAGVPGYGTTNGSGTRRKQATTKKRQSSRKRLGSKK